MFAIGFHVHTEIFVVLGVVETVVLFQAIDLRFGDRWDLALISVERAKPSAVAPSPQTERKVSINAVVSGCFAVARTSLLPKCPATPQTAARAPGDSAAGFFVDQVIQNLPARRLIVALRMDSRKVGREGRDVMIILLRVISQRFLAQFASRPGEIKRMGEQMFRGDLLIDASRDVGSWQIPLRLQAFLQRADRQRQSFLQRWPPDQLFCRMCLIPRIGMTTQSGRLFNS